MPSTYNTRFFFRLESVRGREFRIDIKELGYSGPAEQRHLGATPVLKQDEGGNGIFGTSLEIIAECATDNEFAELYTSDPRKFYVTLTDVTAAAVIWDGFVSPELYSAPEIAPPYDVQIIAVDGLGELKRYNFPASGRQTLLYHLQTILDFSGLDSGNSKILIVDSLHCATPSVSAAGLLGSVSVDLDHFADDGFTCYEALEAILRTLNLTITRRACKWLLVRESDVDVDGSAISARTAGGTAVTLPVIEYGSMRTHEWWPVGRMENEIDPAKSAIAALYVFRMRSSMLTNPSLETGTGWTYPARTQGAQNYVSWVPLKGTSRPGLTAGGSAILTDQSVDIYQDIQVEAFSGPLTLRLLTMNFMADVQTFGGEYKVYFDLILQASGGNRYVLKIKDGKAEWLLNPGSSASPNSFTAQKLIGFTSSTDIPISAFNSDEFSVPGIPAAGTLRVRISAITKLIQTVDSYFILGGVYLLQDSVPGYKDSIIIDNSARGAAGDVDMAFGDRPVVANALLNFRNILTASGALTSEWATSQFTGEFLSVIAMDNALGISLPRLIARGTLNVPASESLPTVIVNPDGMPMLIRRYSWKLLDDELDVDLLSVPSASIEITSETIRDLTDEEARAASGSGYVSPAGSGGSSTFIGGPRYFEDVEDERGNRIGAKSLYDLFIIQQEADEEEETPEVLKNISEVLRHLFLVEVDDVPYIRADIGFFSDSSVSAGGLSTSGGGGGGGGIDPAAMWALLAAPTSEPINVTHIASILTPYATQAWVQSQGYLTNADLPEPFDPLPIVTRLADHSARIEALEGWLDMPVLDELAVASLTVERSLSLGGTALVYDYEHDAWHLLGNFYADGFVSAGGVSDTGSGSGGGIDPAAMWALLGAATGEQINASHLGTALTPYATKVWVQSQGYLTRDDLPDLYDDLPLATAVATQSERIATLERWFDLPVLDELETTSLTVTNSVSVGGMALVYDAAHDAWHLMGNFYADGFVSAGGISDTESGSGGGINADAMWALLGAATAEQINASHLAGILTDYATKAWVQSQITPVTYQTVTTALGYVPLQASDLLPVTTQQQKAEIALAGRIAEHSERLASVERWFDLPVLDELAVASLTVERSLALGGATLVYDYAHDAWHLMGNFYADGFVSAGGISDTEGGSGGGIDADALWQLLGAATSEPVNASHLPLSVTTRGTGNYVTGLSYSGGVFTVSKATLPTSYVTSVGLAAPTGFTVSGTPVSSAGTLRLSFATGYALPLSADTAKGVTAYGWGDHAQAGYAMAASLEATQLALSTRIATQETRLASVERWLDLPVLDELNVTSLRAERTLTVGAITMVFDPVNNAWHIKGNMYADGFVSAGGYSGAHTTGGITETALWQLLGAATGEQISITHLTTALDPYATKQWVIDRGSGAVTRQAVVEALGYVPLSPDDMLPLATAIGKQEQRIASLERWFDIPVLDELNVASLRVERSLSIGPITLTYDYANAALHVVGNMYADGFVSAGGMSDNQSGTGGGIDADAMWALLSAATTEQVNASHLPLSVTTSGTGNYVASLSYLGGVFTAALATLPTQLPNPQALTFGSKTYDGSAARTLVASDLGAVTQSSVINRAATLASGSTVTLAQIGSVNITAVVPAFAAADHTHAYNTLTGLPTALKNPYALTFGSKTYDGSAAKTIVASDLGAVTQSSVENKAATLTAGATVTLAKIGTTNITAVVPAFALASALANYLPLTGGTMANTNRVVNMNADLLDGQHGAYYATAAGLSDANAAIATLSQETAAAVAALTASQETAELSLGTAVAAHGERLASLDRWFEIPVLDDLSVASLTVERSVSVGGMVLTYDAVNDAWHLMGNFYADGFVSAGGMSDNQSGTGGIDAGAMWQLLGAATTEPVNASHLPLSIATSGSGNYVASLSYLGGVFTASMAALPTQLPNPQALTFGNKTYDGSAARTLLAADIGALTQSSVDNKNASLTSGSTVTLATIGSTNITVRVPNFAVMADLESYLSRNGGSMATTTRVDNMNADLLDGHHADYFARASHSHAWTDITDRPTALKNPYALTYGNKSYDGSAARTLTAADIGALTAHQTVTNKNASLTPDRTVTIATIGGTDITVRVPDFAYDVSLDGYLPLTGGTMTNSNLVTNLNADLLDGQHGSYYAAASRVTTLEGYFTSGVAKSALRLSGTAARTAWGQTYWSDGVPASISGAMSSVSNIDALLYFNTSASRVGVNASNPAYTLDVGGTLRATGHVYAQDRLYLGGNSAYMNYDGDNRGIHASVGFYSDSFVSAGGVSTTSDERLKDHVLGISESRARQVLAALRPVEFRWKCGGGQSAGFVAQEVEEVLPWAVSELGGVKRLQYDVLFTYGMAGLNALMLWQETHEQKIMRLERRVEYLENELRKHQ